MIERLGHKFFKQNDWIYEKWEGQYMFCIQCSLIIMMDRDILYYNKHQRYIDFNSKLDISCNEYIIKNLLE